MTTKYEIIHDGETFYTSDPVHPYSQAGFESYLIRKVILLESWRNPGLFSLFKIEGDARQHVASATAGNLHA